MKRDRSYRREQRRRSIHRKERILRQIGGDELVRAWARGSTGRFAKGKIHCSCPMCRRKSCDAPPRRDKRMAAHAAGQLRELR